MIARPAEQIADGEVLEGESAVDESMRDGEPVPCRTRRRATSSLERRSTDGDAARARRRDGADSALARIIRLVEDAQGSKAPIQRLADQIAAVFVPVVIGIAALTFLAWWLIGLTLALTYAILNAVAVLVIACPCALGLATLTAIMALCTAQRRRAC
ncbi:MAG: hypothetical protein U0360_05720 [Dehalococcoidia bacterium]